MLCYHVKSCVNTDHPWFGMRAITPKDMATSSTLAESFPSWQAIKAMPTPPCRAAPCLLIPFHLHTG